MWVAIVIGLIVIVIMALNGSSGARSLLKVIAALGIIAVLVIGGMIYSSSRDAEQRRRREEARKASCRAPAASECLYRELGRAREKIQAAITSLRANYPNTTISEAKSLLDRAFDASGYVTVANDNSRKLLVYSLRPRCEVEKKFSFLVNVGFSPDERSVAYLNTWWQDAENADEYLRSWESCVTKPQHVDYSGFDAQLSMDYSRLPRTVATPPSKPLGRATAGQAAKGRGSLSEDDDPCAVRIGTDERLRRLRKYGSVRQTGSDTYEAGSHRVVLSGDTLIYCR